jgi:Ca2+/Na+ antiporter
MAEEIIYSEKLQSNKTEALFVGLTVVFFLVFMWRMSLGSLDVLGAVFLAFFVMFLFYSLNYRTLVIQISATALRLKFGILSWRVALDNIENCRLDELPTLMRQGGAGIHFMLIRNRYRASLNFLEYPRVVVALKKKIGPVRDISFSTQQPDEIIQVIKRLNHETQRSTKIHQENLIFPS